MTIILKKLTPELADDVDKIDGSFQIESRLQLSSAQGVVDFTIVPVEPRTKQYEQDDPEELASYIGTTSKLAMIAYSNSQPAGLVLMSRNWNGYAIIDNIKVDIAYRNAGIAKMLMDGAVDWAKSHSLSGLMLETHDNNVRAFLA